MKKSFIEELFETDIVQRRKEKARAEYSGAAGQAIDELDKKLFEGFTSEQAELFDRYILMQSDRFYDETFLFFRKGLEIGLRLGMECSEDQR